LSPTASLAASRSIELRKYNRSTDGGLFASGAATGSQADGAGYLSAMPRNRSLAATATETSERPAVLMRVRAPTSSLMVAVLSFFLTMIVTR
jgi:hypothetical protein